MIQGETKIMNKIVYVCVNKTGTIEKLCKVKFLPRLYLEILNGINKMMPIPDLRVFCNKNKYIERKERNVR